MDHDHHHDELIESIATEYQGILSRSTQAIYIYLDDVHKVCNKKFAALLGYQSADEWAHIDTSFTEAFVADESQETLVSSFQDAMENGAGSSSTIVWKKKDGSLIRTTVILVPVSHNGHLFALHFVSKQTGK